MQRVLLDIEPDIAINMIVNNFGLEEGQAFKEYKSWRENFLNQYSRKPLLPPRTSKKVTLDKKKVLDMYFKKKMSTEAIGREFKVSGITVRKYIREWGYELENRRKTHGKSSRI